MLDFVSGFLAGTRQRTGYLTHDYRITCVDGIRALVEFQAHLLERVGSAAPAAALDRDDDKLV
jgi:hypothetical protein